MSRFLTSAARAWNDFFHASCDPRVLALLRMGFATLVLIHWFALADELQMLWSDRGIVPLPELYAVAGGFVPSLFSVLPRSDAVLWLGYGLLGLHAALLLVGYRSRLQLIALLIWLISFQNRNPLLVNGQDAVLRLIGFFLVFAPLGARWSLDRRLGRCVASSAPYFPLRLVQIQIVLVMLAAGIWKLRGDDWTSGNALYYVTRLEGFWGNLPVPLALHASPRLLRAATFGTLALEIAVPILIWLPRTRRIALGLAFSFHASLAYAMNLFLFAPIMLLGWCAFLISDDLDLIARFWARARQRIQPKQLDTPGELA